LHRFSRPNAHLRDKPRLRLSQIEAKLPGELCYSRKKSWCRAHLWVMAFLCCWGALGWSQDAGPNAAVRAADSTAGNVGLEPAAEPVSPGSIHGTVVSSEGAVYEGVNVSLVSGAIPARVTTTDSNGHFDFIDVVPGTFRLLLSTTGFGTQTISGFLHPGESYQAETIVLLMSGAANEIHVTASRQEIAQEQVKEEEQQRVLGFLPNFYVVYAPDAPPLTRKEKFSLAWKSSIDPISFLASGVFAGVEQATNSYSGYGQGAQGYGKRYGANFADGFIGNMVGGAILPSVFKQDPRYFYQGTGTTRSRMMHAIASAVMCKGDNGRWQVNYSGIGGSLASGGISNIYYPAASRDGLGLTVSDTFIGIGGSAIQNLLQEFVVRRFTPHLPNYGGPKP